MVVPLCYVGWYLGFVVARFHALKLLIFFDDFETSESVELVITPICQLVAYQHRFVGVALLHCSIASPKSLRIASSDLTNCRTRLREPQIEIYNGSPIMERCHRDHNHVRKLAVL